MGCQEATSDESSYEQLFVPPDFITKNTDVRTDGRIDVDINSRLARTLSRLVPNTDYHDEPLPPPYTAHQDTVFSLKLNIVIQVVGSRGDVQPFIALGCELQKHGHRVRIATHGTFAAFVRKSDLEFYSIGGDPAELMAYMVKNPALIPSMKSLRAGDIQKKRSMIAEMLAGCWKSCIQPDELSGVPFVADAIIANPPSFAHVHCAEALGVPVHLMFTMPWTNTKAFTHPLANLKFAGIDKGMANYISYGVVDFITWQGLRDLINSWRRKTLGLEHVPLTEGPGLLNTLEIPFTYCWSPALVPKPNDWGSHIDVCGFFFRDTPQYDPPPDLADFLRAGSKPVYIGFGSIVIEDPDKLTEIVLAAIKTTGVRAIVSRGWSKLGAGQPPNPDVLFLDDCPHEWLFQQVSAVVHHGGAGTTACGLLNGKPTTIVPFFGDQPFWGDMVAAANAGPSPIPHKALNSQNLADALRFCLRPEANVAAREISKRMSTESGVTEAVRSFHKHLSVEKLQCDLIPSQPAAWSYKRGKLEMKLSKLAVGILSEIEVIDQKFLQLYSTKPIVIDVKRWDPISAAASASLATATDVAGATIDIIRRPVEEFKNKTHNGAEAQSSSNARDHETTRRSAEQSSLERDSLNSPIETDLIQLSQAGGKSHNGLQVAGAMALASASSIGRVFISSTKGVLVDIPLATAEGMRALPRIYDSKQRDHGKITDVRSGMVVAGKTFGYGVYEGFTDVFVHTFQGKKKEGAKGVAKGLGKGLMSLTMKTGAGALGLTAYAGEGVYKSLRKMVKGDGKDEIVSSKFEEGKWMLGTKIEGVDSVLVISEFLARRAD